MTASTWKSMLNWLATGLALAVCAAGIALVLWELWPTGEAPLLSLPRLFAVVGVIGVPVLLTWVVALPFSRAHRLSYSLVTPAASDFKLTGDATAQVRWSRVIDVVRETWMYERERFQNSLDRIMPNAILLGATTSVILAAAVLAAAWRWHAPGFVPPGLEIVTMLALSVAVASAASFALNLGRILVRTASQDYNARMFSWATRSLVLAVVADMGLWVLFLKASGPAVTSTRSGAILLGLFSAGLGDRAMELLIEKAATVFGAAAPSRTASTLKEIDGVTDADVERFEEEGVLSVHDLAFAPTARLFFNTTHSLQRICDWQDQALLRAYLGPERCKEIFGKLAIRGAIDFQGLTEDVLVGHDPNPSSQGRPAAQGPGLLEVVKGVLHMDTEAACREALSTFLSDEATMRLRIHFRSTPSEPAAEGTVLDRAAAIERLAVERAAGQAKAVETAAERQVHAVVAREVASWGLNLLRHRGGGDRRPSTGGDS